MAGQRNWLEVDVVHRVLTQATVDVRVISGEEYVRRVEKRIGPNGALTLESPLEAMFVVWWTALDWFRRPARFELYPQREVSLDTGNYRVDFAIEPQPETLRAITSAGLSWQPIAIELDGHAFHEKTLEQVTYRNRRDRALQQAGWRVLHASFSELQRNGPDTVVEIYLTADAQLKSLEAALAAQRTTES